MKNKQEEKQEEKQENVSEPEVKKANRLRTILKSLGIVSGGGGIAGIILAISGICLPCVLIPLGFAGAGLMVFFSFISQYKWIFIVAAVACLVAAFFLKRRTTCKNGVCRIDTQKKKKTFKTVVLGNWKVYTAFPITLLCASLVYLFILAPKGNTEEVKNVAPQMLSKGAGETTIPMAKPQDPTAPLLENAVIKGPSTAKVTIIELSDYFCPYCLDLYTRSMKPILKKYQGQVRFASQQVVVLDTMSYSSTHASRCAEEQGRYWDIHEKLMERVRPFLGLPHTLSNLRKMQELSKKTTTDVLTKLAGTISGIDTTVFRSCMDSDRYRSEIAQTTEVFRRYGFRGVPVLLINKRLVNSNDPAEIDMIVQQELNR